MDGGHIRTLADAPVDFIFDHSRKIIGHDHRIGPQSHLLPFRRGLSDLDATAMTSASQIAG
jgi:hypothetical protein